MDQELDYLDTNIPLIGNADKYTIYPNPATDQLFIHSPDIFPNYPFTIRLFDLNKIERWKQTLVPRPNQTKINLSLPDLTPELFILELSNARGSSSWKVFVE